MKVEVIDKKIESFEKTRKSLKKTFENFIVDKKIPLSERYLLWENAPDALKNHESFIHRGDTTKAGEAFNKWVRGFDYIRGGFNIASMLEDSSYWVTHPEENDEYADEREEDIELIMEYVLKKNIGSFDWDW